VPHPRRSKDRLPSGAASARASGDTITLTTWVGTWNVGNVAPKMDAVTQWLARARGHDLVAVAAQEASYPHSRANLKPEAVWAETLAARRGGDAEAENARDAATARPRGGLDGLRLRLGGGADLRRGTRRVGRRWNRCALG
jgi:hypothetical protein